MAVVNFILDCGPTVMLPIIIFILGVIMGAGVSKSFKSGVTIGIGFAGIGLVTGMLATNLAPVAQAMTERLGLHMDIIDIGWPAMSSITWAWSAAGLMIPICLIVNFILLTLKITKTMNVDIWNFWQFAFVGSAVSVITKSIVAGLVAGALISAVALVLADVTQPYIEKFFHMPGISFPHLTALGCLPIVMPMVWILDRIPGINKININAESLRKKFGIFGEPMMMGLIIGIVLAILAGSAPKVILQTGIGLAAVMLLMPKMVSVLMEGLIPISQAAQKMMSKRFKGREIYIGLDAAVSLGEPAVIAVGLVLVPITILLAVIIPGNRILPFADLAVIPYIVCLFTAMSKGNIFRALIIGTVVMGCILLMASTLGPIETPMAVAAGVKIPHGATLIGNLDRANLLSWLFIKLFSIF